MSIPGRLILPDWAGGSGSSTSQARDTEAQYSRPIIISCDPYGGRKETDQEEGSQEENWNTGNVNADIDLQDG